MLADCQALFLEGLEAIFEKSDKIKVEVQSKALSTAELKEKVTMSCHDLLIMDINFPGEDGIELIPELKKLCPDMYIMVLTTYTDRKFVKRAFINGVDGYVLKSNDSSDLIQGINTVLEGDTYMSDGLRVTPAPKRTFVTEAVANLTNRYYEDGYTLKQKLTKREQEILNLIADSKNNKQIAKELFISDQTVGVHRKNIMRKLGVRSTVNLIKVAVEHQLV